MDQASSSNSVPAWYSFQHFLSLPFISNFEKGLIRSKSSLVFVSKKPKFVFYNYFVLRIPSTFDLPITIQMSFVTILKIHQQHTILLFC